MKFQWPQMLWLLLALPVLTGTWVWLARRRAAFARRYAGLLMVREAGTATRPWMRHLPAVIFGLALAAAIVASARPSANITLPSQQQTIMLAIDVSLSMRARDVEPNRITAAKAAAKAFVDELPKDVRAGIVSFAGTASVVQPPTTRHEDLHAAIDRFELQRATATGSGLLVSLKALFPDHDIDVESIIFGGGSGRAQGKRLGEPQEGKSAKKPFTPVEPGSYNSAAIILLSDGRRTTGPDPLDAARMAAERGVRVYTVGIGTVEGAEVDFGGMAIYMRLDEEALKAIAEITKGEYTYVGTAADLRKVYQGLGSKLVLEKRETEVTAFLSAAAALFAVLGAGLSLAWFNRIL